MTHLLISASSEHCKANIDACDLFDNVDQKDEETKTKAK